MLSLITLILDMSNVKSKKEARYGEIHICVIFPNHLTSLSLSPPHVSVSFAV